MRGGQDEVLTPGDISIPLTCVIHWAKLLCTFNQWKQVNLTFILQGFPHSFPLAQTLQPHKASAVAYFCDIIWKTPSFPYKVPSEVSEVGTLFPEEQGCISHLFSKSQTNIHQMITYHDYPDETYSDQ